MREYWIALWIAWCDFLTVILQYFPVVQMSGRTRLHSLEWEALTFPCVIRQTFVSHKTVKCQIYSEGNRKQEWTWRLKLQPTACHVKLLLYSFTHFFTQFLKLLHKNPSILPFYLLLYLLLIYRWPFILVKFYFSAFRYWQEGLVYLVSQDKQDSHTLTIHSEVGHTFNSL